MRQITELLIRIFTLLVLLILNFAILSNGLKLDEKNCQIKIGNEIKMPDGRVNRVVFNFSIIDVYDNFLQGKCLIKYNEEIGFYETTNLNP